MSMSEDIKKFLRSDPTFLEHSDQHFLCTICKKVLVSTCVNSKCACCYCRDCATELFSGDSQCCPGVSEECTEKVTMTDVNDLMAVDRKVMGLQTCCGFTGKCGFQGTVSQTVKHMAECEAGRLRCPFADVGCPSGGLKGEEVGQHLAAQAEQHSRLLVACMTTKFTDSQRSQQSLRSTVDRMRAEIDDIVRHKRYLERLRQDNADVRRMVELEIKDSKALRSKLLEPLKTASLATKTAIAEATLFGELEKLRKRLDILETAQMSMETASQANKSALLTVQASLETANPGQFVWRIDKLPELREKAQAGDTTAMALQSNSFWSHACGYKLRLLLNPYGQLQGHGTHLSLGFRVEMSEHDGALSWPMRHLVSVALVSQTDGSDIKSFSEQYNTARTPFKSLFQRPITDHNKRFGNPTFYSWEDLSTNAAAMTDGVVFFRCVVRPPPPAPTPAK